MRPEHYSREIVQRCHSLISHLLPVVKKGFADDRQFGGPLDTTFLLAMATPMVVLPLERIQSPGKYGAYVADDRDIDQRLTDAIDSVLGRQCPFAAAPFAAKDRWRFVPAYNPIFDLADGIPEEALRQLASAEAGVQANEAPASIIMRNLRNSLTHGGVAYLDKNGMSTERDAAMFAFVSQERDEKRKLVGLNILRVSEEDFMNFLGGWAAWISAS